MKKKTLDVKADIRYTVIGIVASIKDYTLAWKINQVFEVEMILTNDLKIFLKNHEALFSKFCYQSDLFTLNLIKNKGLNKEKVTYFVPELNQIDYFLLINNSDYFMKPKKMIERLQSVNEINFIQEIDTEKIKSKDNFIF